MKSLVYLNDFKRIRENSALSAPVLSQSEGISAAKLFLQLSQYLISNI